MLEDNCGTDCQCIEAHATYWAAAASVAYIDVLLANEVLAEAEENAGYWAYRWAFDCGTAFREAVRVTPSNEELKNRADERAKRVALLKAAREQGLKVMQMLKKETPK